jgi:DNA adenine methylase
MRPILRYHGGKWLLAPWIISHFPEHKKYIEPFGGAGSVLIRKQRTRVEIFNELDGEIVNLFAVARDHGNELFEKLQLTPFARMEFELSYVKSDDAIEQARRTIVRSFFGFGSASACGKQTGFRSRTGGHGTIGTVDFANYADAFPELIKRLKGVCIENQDAVKIIEKHDCFDSLIYCDPPYLKETRHKGEKTNEYRFEMSRADHVKMCDALLKCKGTVIVSGYDNALYNKKFKRWFKSTKNTFSDGAKHREETLWCNRKLNPQPTLFNP